jgi:hypothetical protein
MSFMLRHAWLVLPSIFVAALTTWPVQAHNAGVSTSRIVKRDSVVDVEINALGRDYEQAAGVRITEAASGVVNRQNRPRHRATSIPPYPRATSPGGPLLQRKFPGPRQPNAAFLRARAAPSPTARPVQAIRRLPVSWHNHFCGGLRKQGVSIGQKIAALARMSRVNSANVFRGRGRDINLC